MKTIFSKYKEINLPILKVSLNGLKFCLVLALFSTYILVLYHSIHNLDLFILGTSLLKSTLFFAVFFVICAFAVDTIRKDLK